LIPQTIRMKNFFSSNIKVLRERKKRTQDDMASFVGMKRSIWNNYENEISKPSIENLVLISEYFGISINTLITLDFTKLSGVELSNLEKGQDIYVKGSRLRILATTVNEKNEDNVELVSVKAKAGYTAGYGDPEFIGKLPSYQFPFLPKDKKHRAFQISGDSMLPIRDRSWIACHYIDDWNDIENGQGYVIVTKDDGIVFKRAYNRIKENGTLLLVSINPLFQPYEIQIRDVIEVWKFALKFSNQLVEEIAG
jgi:transcriptional regulator with XRE-family HTH domain